MERRPFKKEATLTWTAVQIHDADGLLAENVILTYWVQSNNNSFTMTVPSWVLLPTRATKETLLVPLIYTRRRSTHVYLVGCTLDSLGQLQKKKCSEWRTFFAMHTVCDAEDHGCRVAADVAADAFKCSGSRNGRIALSRSQSMFMTMTSRSGRGWMRKCCTAASRLEDAMTDGREHCEVGSKAG